jgi:DNA-directed RNA polymerase subunit RPC12/RpoP
MMKPSWNSQARCPRCHGNLGLEYDPPGSWDIVCLQCGFRHVANQRRAVDNRVLFQTESLNEEKAA